MTKEKESFYRSLNQQLTGLLEGERNAITNLSQFSAFMNASLDEINWVGFYLSQPNTDLLLGPFQGEVACIRIPLGKGVCGVAAQQLKTLVVEDVDQFDGHIACDARSRSEIVCPIVVNEHLIGVLDIDSPIKSRFDEGDAKGMNLLVDTLIASTDLI